ncbi:MAG: trypsin-like peptidase domain-containing protein [Clostridia bacterium]|nr:trypsin-like peptidase domain-containing protein [Clostridia bacterium]
MNEFKNDRDDQNTELTPEENRPAYVWDGKQGGNRRRGKKPFMFFVVAVVCLALTAAICIPTVLYAMDGSHIPDGSKDPSGGTLSGGDQSREETSYDVSETVSITDSPFLEENALTQVYKKCQSSCATIYVEIGNTGYSIGSGFVLTEDGYMATNQHVVDDGTKVTVIFYDGTEYEAEVVGEDAIRDLAVLKIDAKGLAPLELGDSDALSVGQTTIAIGTPYDQELAGTMTMGIISGLNRGISIENDAGVATKTMHLIQTDTPINPGNSGGPLINMAGQVVGINSLKLIDEYEGIGFAIPINSAVEIFNQLIQYGEVVQAPENDFVIENPRLGVQVYELEAGLENFRIKPRCEYPKEGVLVASVEPHTAVYAAGLELYDIITDFNGTPIKGLQDLTNALKQYRAGDKVTITVFSFSRNFSEGEYKTLEFILDSAEAIG